MIWSSLTRMVFGTSACSLIRRVIVASTLSCVIGVSLSVQAITLCSGARAIVKTEAISCDKANIITLILIIQWIHCGCAWDWAVESGTKICLWEDQIYTVGWTNSIENNEHKVINAPLRQPAQLGRTVSRVQHLFAVCKVLTLVDRTDQLQSNELDPPRASSL